MIKKIIFDLDNTLIMWEDKYWGTLKQALDTYEIPYNEDTLLKLKEAVDIYEDKHNMYNKQDMYNLMQQYVDINLPSDYVDKWIYYLKECYPKNLDSELKDTLEYLKEKYNLVVLTNWFKDQQQERLKRYGILVYFNKVIGTDYIKNKPNAEAFIHACHPYEPSECVMVGDNLKIDIEGALNAGLNAIYFDYKNEYNGDLPNIKKIKELIKIL